MSIFLIDMVFSTLFVSFFICVGNKTTTQLNNENESKHLENIGTIRKG
jgi:hypothetical protein